MSDVPKPIQEANRKVGEYRKSLEAAQAKVVEVQAKLNEYESFIKVWKELNPQETEPEISLDANAIAKKVKGKTIADAAEIVLEMAGGILPTIQIAGALVEARVLKKSKWAYNTVHKTLSKDDRFRPVRRGIYGLANPPKVSQREAS